jgi:hypothetical protein
VYLGKINEILDFELFEYLGHLEISFVRLIFDLTPHIGTFLRHKIIYRYFALKFYKKCIFDFVLKLSSRPGDLLIKFHTNS